MLDKGTETVEDIWTELKKFGKILKKLALVKFDKDYVEFVNKNVADMREHMPNLEEFFMVYKLKKTEISQYHELRKLERKLQRRWWPNNLKRVVVILVDAHWQIIRNFSLKTVPIRDNEYPKYSISIPKKP